MEENKEIEIDLRKVFMMLRKKAAIILIISFIGAALSGCVTNLLIKPKYTAGVSFYVNNNNDNLIGSTGTITSSDLDASERLVNTYMFVVNSRTFLNKVADKLADGTTATQLSKMISTSQVESTLAFQVNVTTENNQFSADVANIIAELAPDEIVRVLKVGGVEVIDYASAPNKPSSPNLKKNVLIGFAVAFVAAFAVFFIKELFDTRIMTESDLTRDFDIPVLGTVPRLLPVDERSHCTTAPLWRTLQIRFQERRENKKWHFQKRKTTKARICTFQERTRKKFFPPLPRLLLKRLTVQFVQTSFSRKRAMNVLYSS